MIGPAKFHIHTVSSRRRTCLWTVGENLNLPPSELKRHSALRSRPDNTPQLGARRINSAGDHWPGDAKHARSTFFAFARNSFTMASKLA